MRICCVVNPKAGTGRGDQIAGDAETLLVKHGVECVFRRSEYAGHAVEIARELDPTEWDGVIALGGDGTLFEILNGLMKGPGLSKTVVGQIPVGTGNSFIKDLGVETVEDAVERIVSGSTRSIDMGRLQCKEGEYYFVNLLGAGFVSNVAYRASKYKAFGALSYVFGVFEELLVLRATPSKLVVDGTEYQRECLFIEICNSRYTGGNMLMAPDACIDDGLFDIVLVNRITRRTLLKLFPRIFKGTHVDDPAVEVIRGKKIEFYSETPLALVPDGETFGTTPITVEMLPGLLRMYG